MPIEENDHESGYGTEAVERASRGGTRALWRAASGTIPVSYTHLRAHETVLDLVCRLLLEKTQQMMTTKSQRANE